MRVVDKWKKKKWYEVLSPEMFDKKQLGEIVAEDEKYLENRIIKKSLAELGVGATSQVAMFTTLHFRVKDVKATTAETMLIGHQIEPSYIKTFARRGRTLIHQVVDEKTKDGKEVRAKIIAVTGSRVSENTKRNLRTALVEETRDAIKKSNLKEAMEDIIYGRLSAKIYNRLKQITKMRRVEVGKSEIKESFN